MTVHSSHSLEEQRVEFSRSRFLAMPIAGTIAWAIIGITSPFVSVNLAAWILFICTGTIFALVLFSCSPDAHDPNKERRPVRHAASDCP